LISWIGRSGWCGFYFKKKELSLQRSQLEQWNNGVTRQWLPVEREGALIRTALPVKGFGLELAKEKTGCIEFGRFALEDALKRGEKPKEFTFPLNTSVVMHKGLPWPNIESFTMIAKMDWLVI
jgi:hypothetical protein